jgi:hypothetical protein
MDLRYSSLGLLQKTMAYSILEFGFPLFLVVVELLARSAVHIDATAFIGPAIATAGLVFMIPLMKPKSLSGVDPKILEEVRRRGGQIVSTADQAFIVLVLGCILGGFIVWLWACETSTVAPTDNLFYPVPKHAAIGFINYIAAVVCTAIKSRL